MEHHSKKWYFIKQRITQILNLSVSKCSLESFYNRSQIYDVNSLPLWRCRPGKATILHLLSKNEGPRDIGHSMTMKLDPRKFNFYNQWFWFYRWFIVIFYYKTRQGFITKCVRFIITKYNSFINICDSYYTMRQPLNEPRLEVVRVHI